MTNRTITLVRVLILAVLLFSASAVWAQTTVYIAVQIEPLGTGTVYGAGFHAEGAFVFLQAEPNPGFRFMGWMEGGALLETSSVLEFIAEENRDLVAQFESTLFFSGLRGLWSGRFGLLPSLHVGASRLDLTFGFRVGISPLTVRVSADFTTVEWRSLAFHGRGNLLRIPFSFGLTVDPATASYRSSHFGLMGTVNALRWRLWVRHSLRGGTPPRSHLLYTLSIHLHPFSLTAHLEDEGGGLEFKNILARTSSLPLLKEAFGIRGQGWVFFTREKGFAHADIQLRGILLPFLGGLAFDARVRYTTAAKELSLSPRWVWLRHTGNITMYGDITWNEHYALLDGFEVYGFKVRCFLACAICPGARISAPFVEVMLATVPARVPGGFRREEFAYWRFGTCGPAGCGAYYSLEATVFFSSTGGLLGVSRIAVTTDIPLATGFSTQVKFQAGILAPVALELGWRWSF